jgi:hypothetical protein
MRAGTLIALMLGGIASGACGGPPSDVPAPPRPSPGTTVNASFGRTWSAAIAQAAIDHMAIRTAVDSEGRIVTETTDLHIVFRSPHLAPYEGRVPTYEEWKSISATWADCGGSTGVRMGPDSLALYIRVRGDSASSTVLITAYWLMDQPYGSSFVCSTRGIFEHQEEAAIARAAEQR